MEKEKLSVKITIAERVYPLKINYEDEERMRLAVKLLNERVEAFRERFKDRDIQDALSMAVLHFAVKVVELEQNTEFDSLLEEIKNLDKQLGEYISNTI
jgi:Cell division protein ZapA.